MVTTPVLGLTKPVVGADQDTWGALLNGDLDLLDTWAGTINAAIAALNGKVIPAGTRMLFQQTAAPTGWTKDTTLNDRALRIVSGAVGSGGSLAFTTAFSSRGIAGSSDAVTVTGGTYSHVLTYGQMPNHSHSNNYRGSNLTGTIYSNPRSGINALSDPQSLGLTYEGGNEGHNHGFWSDAHSHSVSSALDMSVAYADVIIAVKN